MLPTDKDDDEDDKFVINFFRGNKKVILDVLDWEITRLVCSIAKSHCQGVLLNFAKLCN